LGLMLRAEGLVKSYNGRPVLNGVDYEFSPEKIYALMGPNGSGKSTLLRILGLLEFPDNGSVVYSNAEFHQGEKGMLLPGLPLKRRISLILADLGLFNKSVLANAEYGLKIRGVNKSARREKAMDALSAMGLGEKSRQNALTLSSGEAQRLAMARAIAIEPEVLFLDEPTASVDRENTEIIERAMTAMKGDRTVVFSSHDEKQAARVADVVLEIKDGRIA